MKDEHIWVLSAQDFVVESIDDCVEFDPPRFFQTDLETHRSWKLDMQVCDHFGVEVAYAKIGLDELAGKPTWCLLLQSPYDHNPLYAVDTANVHRSKRLTSKGILVRSPALLILDVEIIGGVRRQDERTSTRCVRCVRTCSGRTPSNRGGGPPLESPPKRDRRSRGSETHSERVNIKALPASDSEAERRRSPPAKSRRHKEREHREDKRASRSYSRERSRRGKSRSGEEGGDSTREKAPSKDWRPTLRLEERRSNRVPEPPSPPRVSLHRRAETPEAETSPPDRLPPSAKGREKGEPAEVNPREVTPSAPTRDVEPEAPSSAHAEPDAGIAKGKGKKGKGFAGAGKGKKGKGSPDWASFGLWWPAWINPPKKKNRGLKRIDWWAERGNKGKGKSKGSPSKGGGVTLGSSPDPPVEGTVTSDPPISAAPVVPSTGGSEPPAETGAEEAERALRSRERKQIEGVGYLLEWKVKTEADQDLWINNCLPEGGQDRETQDLLDASLRLQGGQPGVPTAPLGEAMPEIEEKEPTPKKLSGKQKVRKMIEKAKWTPLGTPLDPGFKRPIRLKVQKKRCSSSSSSAGSSSSRSSEGGLGSEHRLRAVGKKLPGYLARQSAKEALKLLASQTGETLQSYQVFNRYYRQVVQVRGGSRGLQRELYTLSSVVDLLIGGDILGSLDILCQRIKSLELLKQGAEPALAMQVELLPREQLGLTQDVEGRFAHKEFAAETRLMRQLRSSPGQLPLDPRERKEGEEPQQGYLQRKGDQEGRGEPSGDAYSSLLEGSGSQMKDPSSKKEALKGLLEKKKIEFRNRGGEVAETAHGKIQVGTGFPPSPPTLEELTILASRPDFSGFPAALGAPTLSHGCESTALPGLLGEA
eukprot:s2854_g1.t1